MSNIRREQGPNDSLINQIIDQEWAQFQKVENIGGRAGCQDDYDTFYIMRYSQHSVLKSDTLHCYLQDLLTADLLGRNMISEKYGYMMEFTDPAYYQANLASILPPLTGEKAQIIAEIVSLQLISHRAFADRYPTLASAGRPEQQDGWETSIKAYSIGELKTYSQYTLELFLRDLQADPDMVTHIEQITASFYGYADLEAAEAATKRQRG